MISPLTTGRPVRLSRPEYTGANRCLPCTVLNLVLAAALSTALALVSPPIGLATWVTSVVLIYYRGYLVPGTPAFTRQYLPDWLLAGFGKNGAPIETADVDPAVVLIGAGVLVDEPGARDTVLDPAFADRWEERASDLLHSEEASALDSLARTVGVPTTDLTVSTQRNTVAVAFLDEHLGQWESAAAFCLDVAGMELLAERVTDWHRFAVAARSELVGALRLFVEHCPDCGGAVDLDETTVTSCCSSRDIVAVTCTNCTLRVLELDVDTIELRSAVDPDGASA